MSIQKIIDSFEKHIRLNDKEKVCLTEKFVFKKLKKRQFLLEENEHANEVAFVTSGCLRCYSIDKNGFEHILQFAPELWWITDMYSFISQKESNLNIDALVDSEMYLLSRENQLKLFDEIPQLERYFRILTENALISSRQRLVDGLSLTAKQRYQNFCKIYPTLINDLPQKQIAAYIGVTPEFLSKLRSDYKK